MPREAYERIQHDKRVKRRAESVPTNEEFEAAFDQMRTDIGAGDPGALLVQIGETYHNEGALKRQKTESAARLKDQRAARDPIVQERIDRARARAVEAAQDAAREPAQEQTIDGSDTPAKKKPRLLGVSTARIESEVDRAKASLKQQGVSGLSPSRYGDALHTELRQTAEARLGRRLNPGTEFFNDRPMSEIKNMSPAESAVTVKAWLRQRGIEIPNLTTKLLNTPVGRLKPDLVYREPGLGYQMIDLTGQPNSPHLAKSLLYGLVLGNQ